MRRLIVDTNLYIDWLNAGEHEPVLFDRRRFDLFRRIALSSPLLIKREVTPETYSAVLCAEAFARFHREPHFFLHCSAFLQATPGMRV